MSEIALTLGLVGLTVLGALALFQECIRGGDRDGDALASVAIARTLQAEGHFRIGLIRVRSVDEPAVIVSASARRVRWLPLVRWPHRLSGPFSVRTPHASRWPFAKAGALLGVVAGRAEGVWHLPLPQTDGPIRIKIRLDQDRHRARVYAWWLEQPDRVEVCQGAA